MPSYRLDVRALVRGVRAVSVGNVRRLTHHMLHHWSRFGRPVRLALGDSWARWYPEQSLPVAGRLTDLPNPVEICEGTHAWPTSSRSRSASSPTSAAGCDLMLATRVFLRKSRLGWASL